mmetsp:Transcript_4326/g.14957  ORF Transcript_4326/g.14957 Transcript_4326/m.14957 type:complete len:361 (+) Transcript_4326:75-1157(+)
MNGRSAWSSKAAVRGAELIERGERARGEKLVNLLPRALPDPGDFVLAFREGIAARDDKVEIRDGVGGGLHRLRLEAVARFGEERPELREGCREALVRGLLARHLELALRLRVLLGELAEGCFGVEVSVRRLVRHERRARLLHAERLVAWQREPRLARLLDELDGGGARREPREALGVEARGGCARSLAASPRPRCSRRALLSLGGRALRRFAPPQPLHLPLPRAVHPHVDVRVEVARAHVPAAARRLLDAPLAAARALGQRSVHLAVDAPLHELLLVPRKHLNVRAQVLLEVRDAEHGVLVLELLLERESSLLLSRELLQLLLRRSLDPLPALRLCTLLRRRLSLLRLRDVRRNLLLILR